MSDRIVFYNSANGIYISDGDHRLRFRQSLSPANQFFRDPPPCAEAVSVRSDCPACVIEWVIVSIMDSGHLEVGLGRDEGSEEAALV